MCRWYEYKSGTAYNKRVSGFVPSALRPNPRLSARPSDTRQPLSHVAESLKMIDIFGIMITIHGEGGNQHGKVVEKIKVTNFKDPSKSIEIEAIIDTGATMSVLPMDLIQKLELEKIDEVNMRYTDNSVKRKEVYGSIILEIAGRKAVFDVLAENEVAQPLIGQIVLERLDLVIEPSTRKVIPNPRSPETPMIDIFMSTSPTADIQLRCYTLPPKTPPRRALYMLETLCEIVLYGDENEPSQI